MKDKDTGTRLERANKQKDSLRPIPLSESNQRCMVEWPERRKARQTLRKRKKKKKRNEGPTSDSESEISCRCSMTAQQGRNARSDGITVNLQWFIAGIGFVSFSYRERVQMDCWLWYTPGRYFRDGPEAPRQFFVQSIYWLFEIVGLNNRRNQRLEQRWVEASINTGLTEGSVS